MVQNLTPIQISWIMLNLKSDADVMQKEFDKMGKSKGTSVVKASTSDSDFESLIQQHINKLKKK